MILFDVNVLVAAHRGDHVHHDVAGAELVGAVASGESLACTTTVSVGFYRVVTHPRVFRVPTAASDAIEFLQRLRDRPQTVPVEPGALHWSIFIGLCRTAGVKGSLATDAHLAAVAIESGSTLVSLDRDFARFPGLRWRHPLDAG